MFLCSLESKFHDLFKTHLTFIFKSLLRDPGSFKVKKQIFEWTPSSAHIMAPKTLRSIFYQMEHIWWAPIGLRNSSRLQLGSQLSPTLYRSFIVTLYIFQRWEIYSWYVNWYNWIIFPHFTVQKYVIFFGQNHTKMTNLWIAAHQRTRFSTN